ncbi:MAG: hypothetical protein ACSHXF_03250 [Aquaticitalea sp.]
MKTFLKRAAIGIVVLLLILVGVLIYRNTVSYKNVIHKDANSIVKIRVDAIGRAIVWDAFKNPSYYYQNQNEKDSIDDDDKLEKGFQLPANVFLFTIKGKSVSTLFTSFNISNSDNFKAYLSSDFNMEKAYKIGNIQVSKNKDGNILAAYTDKQCVLVYNPKKESVDTVFEDVLIKNNTLKSGDDLFDIAKDATSHINYVSLDDRVSINFKRGLAIVEGYVAISDNVTFPKQTLYPEFSEGSSLKFYLNALSSKSNETITFNDFKIETDSINSHYKGNFSIEIANTTLQNNTIVTYEYNDDFEKVETKLLSEKQVPEITLQLSADSQKMLQYLRNEHILKENKLNPELFPLYQVRVDSTSFGLNASTNLNHQINIKKISHDAFFELQIDFEKLKQQNHFPILNPYFEKFLNLDVKGLKDEAKKTKIVGQIKLQNEDILAISQLLL